MKKILAVIAAVSLVFAMAGCNKKDGGSSVTQGSAAVDSEGNEIKGTTIDGAGKEVDMKKVEGESLKAEKDAEGESSKGDVSGFDVSIDEAKVMTTEESKVLVVSFSFKNTSSEPAAFGNLFTVEVTQDGNKVMPTVVNTDGVNVLSAVELIDPGVKTKVQKTYVLSDEENPVEVIVYKYAEPENGMLKKKFNLK